MTLHMRLLSRVFAAAALVVSTASCGDVVRNGRAPMFLVLDRLQGTAGGGALRGIASGTLLSDVIVNLTTPDPCTTASPCPTVFDDFGTATFHLESKDLNVAPTSNNQVTINRYRVTYRRLDGRNTPGVDVPFGFDGAFTGTIAPIGQAIFSFELVRHVAKEESPLRQLIVNPNIILTIADVSFYGTDLVGNAVSVTGSMSIEFGNFGDN